MIRSKEVETLTYEVGRHRAPLLLRWPPPTTSDVNLTESVGVQLRGQVRGMHHDRRQARWWRLQTARPTRVSHEAPRGSTVPPPAFAVAADSLPTGVARRVGVVEGCLRVGEVHAPNRGPREGLGAWVPSTKFYFCWCQIPYELPR